MKGRSLLLTATLILVAGIVLIITYQTTRTTGIVIAGGVLFILVGLLNIFTFMSEKAAAVRALTAERSKAAVHTAQSAGSTREVATAADSTAAPAGYGHMATMLAWVTSGGAVALGLCMLVFTNVFSSLVPTVFAALILLGALFQFYLLAYGSRPLRLPVWLFAVPVALLGVCVYIYLQHAGDDVEEQHVMLATGITFVVYGLVMYIESALMGYGHRQLAKAAAQSAEPKPANTAVELSDKATDKAAEV